MSNIEQKQIENLDQKNNQTIATKETIENILKSKISDPETQAKLFPIFNDIKKEETKKK